MRDVMLGPLVGDEARPSLRRLLHPEDHGTLEDIALHPDLAVLLAQMLDLLAQPTQLLAFRLVQPAGSLRGRAGLGPVNPGLQCALVHTQVPRDLRRRLPGLQHDPYRAFTERRVIRPSLMVTVAGALDIEHMVPLAEAWDSGASAWSAARREAYANDQGQASSLVAVTARSNRSKADQDPAEWLPPPANALCRYAAEWTATKLRWNLAVDELEQDRLLFIAAGCGGESVTYTPAP